MSTNAHTWTTEVVTARKEMVMQYLKRNPKGVLIPDACRILGLTIRQMEYTLELLGTDKVQVLSVRRLNSVNVPSVQRLLKLV